MTDIPELVHMLEKETALLPPGKLAMTAVVYYALCKNTKWAAITDQPRRVTCPDCLRLMGRSESGQIELGFALVVLALVLLFVYLFC